MRIVINFIDNMLLLIAKAIFIPLVYLLEFGYMIVKGKRLFVIVPTDDPSWKECEEPHIEEQKSLIEEERNNGSFWY